MKKVSAEKIAYTAVSIALVVLATTVIRVPSINGYTNIGDSLVIICAVVFGPIIGCIAGGLGSALSDAMLGYAHYIIPSLIIKGIEGLVVGLIVHKAFKTKKIKEIILRLIAADVFAFVCVVFLYLVAKTIIYTAGIKSLQEKGSNSLFINALSSAFLSVPSNSIQMLLSTVIASLVIVSLYKVRHKIYKNEEKESTEVLPPPEKE